MIKRVIFLLAMVVIFVSGCKSESNTTPPAVTAQEEVVQHYYSQKDFLAGIVDYPGVLDKKIKLHEVGKNTRNRFLADENGKFVYGLTEPDNIVILHKKGRFLVHTTMKYDTRNMEPNKYDGIKMSCEPYWMSHAGVEVHYTFGPGGGEAPIPGDYYAECTFTGFVTDSDGHYFETEGRVIDFRN